MTDLYLIELTKDNRTERYVRRDDYPHNDFNLCSLSEADLFQFDEAIRCMDKFYGWEPGDFHARLATEDEIYIITLGRIE